MKKLILEDRAYFRFVGHFKTKTEEIYLEISTHYGNHRLFGLEQQTTDLTRYIGNTKINPCSGYYPLFTNDFITLVNFIKAKYHQDPIFPKDIQDRIKKQLIDFNSDESKGVSWRYPEIRKKLGWS